ncbi:unnamed protein product [Rotaria socialis]|nr:unnamed protein product [Rotaria socialis]
MNALFTSQPDKSDDYYTILGCNELSNKDQIQVEYRIRALRLHPDKNQDDPNTMDQFKQLQEAKEVLSDDVKRKAYDHWRNSHITIPWKTWQSITERSQPVRKYNRKTCEEKKSNDDGRFLTLRSSGRLDE